MIALLLLPGLMLMQALPPPLGQVAATLILGRAFATGPAEAPVPQAQSAPAEDCHCGVPASPRGPR
jgi:hypothetical protein